LSLSALCGRNWLNLLLMLVLAPMAPASELPVPIAALPEQVASWEEAAAAAALAFNGDLPVRQAGVHLGHQARARWFVMPPLGSASLGVARLGAAPIDAADVASVSVPGIDAKTTGTQGASATTDGADADLADRPIVPPTTLILALGVNNLDLVELRFLTPAGRLLSGRLRTGDTLPLAERAVIGAPLAFRLETRLLRDHALILRVKTVSQLSLLPRLVDAVGFELSQARSLVVGGMLAALAGLFALLMLLADLVTGDRRFFAFLMLSLPFSLAGLAITGQLPYFLPLRPASVSGRSPPVLTYLISASLIFAFYLIVDPPPSRWHWRRLWFSVAWLALLLAPIGLTPLQPSLAWLNNGVQLAFLSCFQKYFVVNDPNWATSRPGRLHTLRHHLCPLPVVR
jgi:hypothetical protein